MVSLHVVCFSALSPFKVAKVYHLYPQPSSRLEMGIVTFTKCTRFPMNVMMMVLNMTVILVQLGLAVNSYAALRLFSPKVL